MKSSLSLIAPINKLGYGIVGVYVLDKLLKMGIRVSLFPIGRVEYDEEHEESVRLGLKNAEFFDNSAPSLRIWHQFDMAMHVGEGRRCGFPIFELEDFTKRECHHLHQLEHILVTSEWGKEIVVRNLFDFFLQETNSSEKGNGYKKSVLEGYKRKVQVVPLGVDNDIFNPHSILSNDSTTTIFINIGKWEERKGHSYLIEAFDRAFDEDDDVELWMMCGNPFLSPQDRGLWESMYNSHPKVRLIDRVESHKGVADIIKQADVGVFPSHAEGWNLEALECLACGKQLIVSNCTAHTQFCNKDNAYLIQMGNLEPAYDGVWFNGQGRWSSFGESQMIQLISFMHHMHNNKQAKEFNQEGLKTAQQFSWSNTAKRIVEVLHV